MWRLQSGGRLTLKMLYDYPTNTNSGCNLDHTELFFGTDEGAKWSKMWNSSECLSVCLTLWKHRGVSLIELLHICGSGICAAESIIMRETGLSWDSTGTFHHLCVTGQAIAAATVCFSLLKYKLKGCLFVFLNRTLFTLAMITAVIISTVPLKI